MKFRDLDMNLAEILAAIGVIYDVGTGLINSSLNGIDFTWRKLGLFSLKNNEFADRFKALVVSWKGFFGHIQSLKPANSRDNIIVKLKERVETGEFKSRVH